MQRSARSSSITKTAPRRRWPSPCRQGDKKSACWRAYAHMLAHIRAPRSFLRTRLGVRCPRNRRAPVVIRNVSRPLPRHLRRTTCATPRPHAVGEFAGRGQGGPAAEGGAGRAAQGGAAVGQGAGSAGAGAEGRQQRARERDPPQQRRRQRRRVGRRGLVFGRHCLDGQGARWGGGAGGRYRSLG